MKENEKNEELQSRREFFKNAAKTALPILVVAALGPALLSCEKDEESKSSNSSGCNNNCSGSCSKSCSGSCDGGCSGDCDDGCTADCWNGCDRWQK